LHLLNDVLATLGIAQLDMVDKGARVVGYRLVVSDDRSALARGYDFWHAEGQAAGAAETARRFSI
jgi:hypothetical protein